MIAILPCFCVTGSSTILCSFFSDSLWLKLWLCFLCLLLLLSLKQLIFLQSSSKPLPIVFIETILLSDVQISSLDLIISFPLSSTLQIAKIMLYLSCCFLPGICQSEANSCQLFCAILSCSHGPPSHKINGQKSEWGKMITFQIKPNLFFPYCKA